MQKETFLNSRTLISSVTEGKAILNVYKGKGICTSYAHEKKLEKANAKLDKLHELYVFEALSQYKRALIKASYEALINFIQSEPKDKKEALGCISQLSF